MEGLGLLKGAPQEERPLAKSEYELRAKINEPFRARMYLFACPSPLLVEAGTVEEFRPTLPSAPVSCSGSAHLRARTRAQMARRRSCSSMVAPLTSW